MEADRMDIETPEHVRLSYEIAGFGSRFLAALMDHIFQGLVLVLLVVGLAGLSSVWPAFGERSYALTTIIIAGAAFIFLGYYIIFEMLWNGQTPGKRQAGIRVIRDEGTPITLTESLLRNLIRVVDFLPFLYGVGTVCIVATARCKRLGDLAAGTVVVREHQADGTPPPPPPVPAREELIANLLPSLVRLGDREATAIEQFIERRDSLDPGLRRGLARELTAAVQTALAPLPAGIPADPEAFIEVVYLALLRRRDRL